MYSRLLWRRMTLIILLSLILSLNGCARNLIVLSSRDKIYIVPTGQEVYTTEKKITTDTEMVLMDKGKYLNLVLEANENAR